VDGHRATMEKVCAKVMKAILLECPDKRVQDRG
jgi:hypothetical protein